MSAESKVQGPASSRNAPVGDRRGGGGRRKRDAYVTVSRALAGDLNERQRCAAAAATLARVFQSPLCMVTLTRRGQSINESFSDKSASASVWADYLDALLLEVQAEGHPRCAVYGGKDRDVALLAAPLTAGSFETYGAIGIVLSPNDRREAELALQELRGLASQVSNVFNVQDAAVRRSSVNADDVSDAIQRAARFRSLHEFAFAVTNNLAGRLACDQVSLGWVRRGGAHSQQVKLLSMSGRDQIKPRSPGTHSIRQAMEECLDLKAAVVAQPADKWNGEDEAQRGRLHQQWRADAGPVAVASLPVWAGDDVVAVVSLRRSESSPFRQSDLDEAADLLRPLGPALPLVSQATEGTPARLKRRLSEIGAGLFQPGGWVFKSVVLCVLIAAVWSAFGKLPLKVTAEASVVARERHQVAAPFAGRLAQVQVEAGDVVEAGQVLMRFDTTALALAVEELLAERDTLAAELRVASSAGRTDEAAIVSARLSASEARLRQRRLELSRAEVRSPISGVVLSGDPRAMLGQSLPTGEPLLVVAPKDALEVELAVPERFASEVQAGLPLRFVAQAMPTAGMDASVRQIDPIANPSPTGAVFMARGQLDPSGLPDGLRPGMQGVARVDVGNRPVWWLMSRRLLDFVSMRMGG